MRKKISQAATGQSFILQMGNCAERFKDCNGKKIHNFLRIMLQMACAIETLSGTEVVPVGRIAGQYAKPRSSDSEERDGRVLPSFRGDNVNGFEFDQVSRTPNPARLLEGYFRSAATLNLIRAFWDGEYADIQNLHDWQEHLFRKDLAADSAYLCVLGDMERLGRDMQSVASESPRRFYASHEGLLLDYEEAFTRVDTIKGGHYNTSAHFLWIGERTRNIDGAHVEYFRGIGNPIGLKIGPSASGVDVTRLCRRLNPDNEMGRVTLISRMGMARIASRLPELLKSVEAAGLKVTWMCDPMHGNTRAHGGFKTRDFGDVLEEWSRFAMICKAAGVSPGGIHLEITDEPVTECFGGLGGRTPSEIPDNYGSAVDPRLNAAQGFELAMHVGKTLSKALV